MTYPELMQKRAEAIDAALSDAATFVAFGQEQFDRAIEAAVAAGADRDAFVHFGAGWYGTITWVRETWLPLIERLDSELTEAMKDPHFAQGAFEVEMDNHEYGYHPEDDLVLDAFGYEPKMIGLDEEGYDLIAFCNKETGERMDPATVEAYNRARAVVLKREGYEAYRNSDVQSALEDGSRERPSGLEER